MTAEYFTLLFPLGFADGAIPLLLPLLGECPCSR